MVRTPNTPAPEPKPFQGREHESMLRVFSETLTCVVCDMNLGVHQWEVHAGGKKHQKNARKSSEEPRSGQTEVATVGRAWPDVGYVLKLLGRL